MKIVLLLLIGLIGLYGYIRYLERTSVFFPSRQITAIPADIGLAYEDVYFPTIDGQTLNGWLIAARRSDPTILFFHGNAGNISDRLARIRFLHELGLNVLIIDYRGYGLSTGHPTEKGIYTDALAAYDYLLTREDIDPERIISYGVSLGGAAAIDLATHRPVIALITDSTFSSGKDMAKMIFPLAPSFLISIGMDNLTKIKSVNVPKLMIHSLEDDVVPFALGRKLFDAASEPKYFLKTSGGHNDLEFLEDENFKHQFREFLSAL